jgi:hypothetical protein
MPTVRNDRARLAALMNERRVDLGLRWADVAALGGISAETLRAVRRDPGPLRDLTKAGIENGLQWQRGSVDRILAGGEPASRDPEPQLPELSPAERHRVLALIQDMRAEDAERRGA